MKEEKQAVLTELSDATQLRDLLYEKGKSLERAILDGLQLLGFSASKYNAAGSEFDVIFESAEGRFLGEAEGKDSKAVNVDKLRQLAMNIHEDLEREEVTTQGKAVLFANAFRLSPPAERGCQFTDKCIMAATKSSTALVATSDLYFALQYLANQLTRGHPDEIYAADCRKAILNGVGIVTFPTPLDPTLYN
jgi:hypothetical protein